MPSHKGAQSQLGLYNSQLNLVHSRNEVPTLAAFQGHRCLGLPLPAAIPTGNEPASFRGWEDGSVKTLPLQARGSNFDPNTYIKIQVAGACNPREMETEDP